MQKAALCKDRTPNEHSKKKLQANHEQMIRKLCKGNKRALRISAIKTTFYELMNARENNTEIHICLSQRPQPETQKRR